MSTKKYRPYLTLGELKHLLEILQSSRDSRSVPLIKYLSSFIHQIESGFRKENMSLKPSLESLILSPNPAASSAPIESLLAEFNTNGYKNLSLSESAAVDEYRYDKQLMSMDEEAAYESKLMSGF